MELTLQEAQRLMEENNGSLNLSYLKYWKTTALPEGLPAAVDLDLSLTSITYLPEGQSVSGNLNLSQTPITALPEGLSVGGSLDLRGTKSPPCRKVCP